MIHRLDDARALGIDIGGTKLAIAGVDSSGHIHGRTSFSTDSSRGPAHAIERIASAARRLLEELQWPLDTLAGVGIGCAGPLDPLKGTIDNPYTLPGWEGWNIVADLKIRFETSVFLENDADAALLGECLAGASRGCSHVVLLTFGTGVGGAALVDGKLVRGGDGSHPEFGHMSIDPAGPKCYCGNSGCLESLASGSAIAQSGEPSGLGDASQIFELAAGGHAEARRLVDQALGAAAAAAWTLLHTFTPQRLLLGGGMMDSHFKLFADAMEARTCVASLVSPRAMLVDRAALGNQAGLVGAASLAFPALTD